MFLYSYLWLLHRSAKTSSGKDQFVQNIWHFGPKSLENRVSIWLMHNFTITRLIVCMFVKTKAAENDSNGQLKKLKDAKLSAIKNLLLWNIPELIRTFHFPCPKHLFLTANKYWPKLVKFTDKRAELNVTFLLILCKCWKLLIKYYKFSYYRSTYTQFWSLTSIPLLEYSLP